MHFDLARRILLGAMGGVEMPDAPGSVLGKTWVAIVGAVIGGLTLLFFMSLVLLSVAGMTIPCNAHFILVAVISLSAALSAAFIGGNATAQGSLPIPGLTSQPLAVSVAGGIAVLVIMFVLLSTFYPVGDCPAAAGSSAALEWILDFKQA